MNRCFAWFFWDRGCACARGGGGVLSHTVPYSLSVHGAPLHVANADGRCPPLRGPDTEHRNRNTLGAPRAQPTQGKEGGVGRYGWVWQGKGGGERPMGAAACRGRGYKGRARGSGERPMRAAGCRPPSIQAQGCIRRGGGNPPPPPPPGRPAYAQPLSPERHVPVSMALVTDSHRLQPLWQPPPTAYLNVCEAASEALSLLLHRYPGVHGWAVSSVRVRDPPPLPASPLSLPSGPT